MTVPFLVIISPPEHWSLQQLYCLKGKVFPYSLPSVGPGADPGVQAVISGHPSAAGRAQDRGSSPVRDRRSTTVPRHQPFYYFYCLGHSKNVYDDDDFPQQSFRVSTRAQEQLRRLCVDLCKGCKRFRLIDRLFLIVGYFNNRLMVAALVGGDG